MTDLQAAPADVSAPPPPPPTRAERLKGATHELHEALDGRMMGADLFSSPERYALFLRMQRRFHAEIAPLYSDGALGALVPELAVRAKLAEIDLDLAAVGAERPALGASSVDPRDVPAALGWLYVAEGSSLGAAFLFKAAQKLGFDETSGARHLAAHPEGRGLHWRRFVEALNAAELTPEEDARAEAAAVAAFGRVRAIAEETLSGR
ncbi:biliverdin-producing heme oxygenase [Chenggangzhangella methanolivorans]|uniref:Biliverdin-producing heme oxygenase n=1 Tax=Chenggangzhangella methanolivorans TaxID=1437009 RepID=A0A9E6RDH9_9HYPH|nr:biliverdin-producing heme oxygenase [Chenggangzhangella methanolivorans]QZO01875.1 biliverdin-producing heme oxygenase [Chenggangzhangella methanolivorans]